ncbi:ATP-binding protein [Flavobacterium sp.]|uniref:GAF domain-containing sensor histidine kinase n=1 Tax=Flavobacterium sp. TaxID=239 RepID=UPI0012135EBC|nr:ATP-binding protein [Flavobacterium sp.]RZJ73973.1 MAG: GAF domain-containing protein [Flavobacterium sp.]
MENLPQELKNDVLKIGSIAIVPNLLDVVCRMTGMRFAAVARVTQDRWIACSVKDDIAFGLVAGSELQIETTICNEIRDSEKAVIIENVSEDVIFANHHTPAMYGFQSYISIPIFRKDTTFFGTLCAIDPSPNKLDTPEIVGMFHLFADLISFHLDAIEQLDSSRMNLEQQQSFTVALEQKIKERTIQLEEKNEMLLKSNKELQEFNYISSHDLQEPLRKIQTFVSRIQDSESGQFSEKALTYFDKIRESANRMRELINDLLSYSQTDQDKSKFEVVDLREVVEEVVDDLDEEIVKKSAKVEIGEMCQATVVPFQFSQLFYNIIGNSLKYSSKDRSPEIKIESKLVENLNPENPDLGDGKYCRIRISDNGIGFSQKYADRIFELFQRLHTKSEFSGTGVGLAIVKKIVENHKGVISAKGTLDVGAQFEILIPQA